MAARTWTPEQRQKQREAIQRWQPWRQSTGPQSVEGKATAARNAYAGGIGGGATPNHEGFEPCAALTAQKLDRVGKLTSS